VAALRHIIVMNEARHPPFYMEFKHEDSWGLQASLRDLAMQRRKLRAFDPTLSANYGIRTAVIGCSSQA